MKKFWIIAIIMALFAVTGLFAQDWWFITATDGGARARDNQVNLNRGENFIYLYFRDNMPGQNYDRIRINFEAGAEMTVTFYAVSAPGQLWGAYQGGTRRPNPHPAASAPLTAGHLENNFSIFTHAWTNVANAASFTRNEISGVVLLINNPGSRTTFKMTNVEFLGLR